MEPELRTGKGEGAAVGGDAENGDGAGAVSADLVEKCAATGEELGARELIGTGRCAGDDVGDTQPERQQLELVAGGEEPRGQAAVVQRGPEPVARATEVATDGCGVQTGVDPDEEHSQAGGDDVGDELGLSGEEVGAVGFGWWSGHGGG